MTARSFYAISAVVVDSDPVRYSLQGEFRIGKNFPCFFFKFLQSIVPAAEVSNQ